MWDSGTQDEASDMCDMMNVAVGQWDTEQVSGMCVFDGCSSGTHDKVVACVLHDRCSSGTVGHRTSA
jgi:hypothetical protein